MVACNFFLEDNEKAVYYAGQMVKGYVELVLDEPKSMRSLLLILHGDAHAWYYQNKKNCFGSDQKYLNSETVVIGDPNGPTVELPAGTHRYNFECLLPEEIPASLDFKHRNKKTCGYIRYSMELKLDMKWKVDKEFKKNFKVFRREDLNLIQKLAWPCSVEESKHFGCLCCASGELTMEVSIPQTGYVGGQTIPIMIKYSNKSDKDIGATFAGLKDILIMSSSPDNLIQVDRSIAEDEVASKSGIGVKKMSEAEIKIKLKLPKDLKPSNYGHCKILRKIYELHVTAAGPLSRKNLKVIFPITIGNIPIVSQQASETTNSNKGRLHE